MGSYFYATKMTLVGNNITCFSVGCSPVGASSSPTTPPTPCPTIGCAGGSPGGLLAPQRRSGIVATLRRVQCHPSPSEVLTNSKGMIQLGEKDGNRLHDMVWFGTELDFPHQRVFGSGVRPLAVRPGGGVRAAARRGAGNVPRAADGHRRVARDPTAFGRA